MDHEQLLGHIKAEVQQAKAEILMHLDGYQQRVSSLEADHSWTKKILIALIVVATGLGVGYIEHSYENNQKQEASK